MVVRDAMQKPIKIRDNAWYTDSLLFASTQSKARVGLKAYLTKRRDGSGWTMEVCNVCCILKHGSALLQRETTLDNFDMNDIMPILVFRATKKARWVL